MSTSIAANAMSDGDKRQAREVAFEYAVGDATSTRTSRVASGHHVRWVGGVPRRVFCSPFFRVVC
ncbi:hypothetical protein M404DRAFT_1001239 [Pisolithus tinctorius Marx 270]|uniref:Uncharacterized protein n=1 Tax=Pisolithus tinctorius Marx 270 TaxID=870435 RepID=A0A0C3J3S6_PISTI|nr:hypothetical protein M404DRAFT_1001239 [Pisolithus tinctorius Marx 270]